MTGANRDVTVPNSLDVTVVDNDAPGVLILQSGGSTNVIEPTEVVVVGSGYLSQKTSVRFKLDGPAVTGQVWTVMLTEANTILGPQPQPHRDRTQERDQRYTGHFPLHRNFVRRIPLDRHSGWHGHQRNSVQPVP